MPARVVPDDAPGRDAAIATLQAGGLIAFPTDTVYGIGVAPTTPNGVERLFAAKGRPPDRAIVLLLADVEQAAAIATLTPGGAALAAAFWPGGLTIVLPRRADSALRLALTTDPASPPFETVGLRVPDHPAPRAIARALGALPTTSANRSGEPEARDAAEIESHLGAALDLILDAGPAPGGLPSTVVDATTATVTILRHGAVSDAEIARVLRDAGLPDPVGR
ncbi:MAG TPA: L-threonylcarbamoyladenylate synthase [Candidatus Limnocylindrales bacterium]|nr:L-threonylcarbamoyladenylate synthase [Candidatus Limnocylindrales bacterium]